MSMLLVFANASARARKPRSAHTPPGPVLWSSSSSNLVRRGGSRVGARKASERMIAVSVRRGGISPKLTEKEREVVQYLVSGLTVNDIATRTQRHPSTIYE